MHVGVMFGFLNRPIQRFAIPRHHEETPRNSTVCVKSPGVPDAIRQQGVSRASRRAAIKTHPVPPGLGRRAARRAVAVLRKRVE